MTEHQKEAKTGEVRPLFKHQAEAIDFLAANQFCGLLAHEPGLGKTRTILEAFRRLRKTDPTCRLLVVAPLSLLEAAWHNDLDEFTPEFTFVNVRKNKLGFTSPGDVYAVNYEFFQRKENLKLILRFCHGARVMIALDESSKIKNASSATTKNLLAIRGSFSYRVCSSGTPAPNSEMEYFPQMEFVRPGILGNTFSRFRGEYFYLESARGKLIDTEAMKAQGLIVTNRVMQEFFEKGAEYKLKAGGRDRLFAAISPLIHSARMDDCLDIPEQTDVVRLVKMGPRQLAAYVSMERDLVVELQNVEIAAPFAISKVMKLREITSGFAMYQVAGRGADGTPKILTQVVEVGECPKLDVLNEIVDELGDRQAIIWCHFDWEVEKIVSALSNRDRIEKVNTLCGSTPDKDRSIATFKSGEARYLVANPHSGAHGLTFINAKHNIFFSLDYSWESFFQACRRTRRAGQTEKTVNHLIVATRDKGDTIDEDCLACLRRKATIQEIVYKLRSQGT